MNGPSEFYVVGQTQRVGYHRRLREIDVPTLCCGAL